MIVDKINISQIFDTTPLWDETLFNHRVVGSGIVKNTELTCGNVVGSNVTNQSWEYFPYYYRKVQFVVMFNDNHQGFARRFGLFDDSNGLYLEYLNGSMFCCVKIDGDEKYREKIKYEYTNIPTLFFFDIELNHATVGTIKNEYRIEFKNMKNTNLPIRFNIENTGNKLFSSTMKQMSSVIMTKGIINGYQFSINNGSIGCKINKRSVPILSIRLKLNNAKRLYVQLKKAMIISTKDIMFSIVYNPTLENAMWASVSDSSGMEYDINATKYTDGINVYSAYCITKTSSSCGMYVFDIDDKRPIGLDIDGKKSIVVSIVANKIDKKQPVVYGSFTWKEII